MTSDFQKAFLARGVGNKLFTQEEFDAELQAAQAEIVAMAIQATKEAVLIEREECAKIVDKWADSIASEPEMKQIAEEIRNRIPQQRQ